MKKILVLFLIIWNCKADFLSLEDENQLGEQLLEDVANNKLGDVNMILSQDSSLLNYQQPETKETPLIVAADKGFADITKVLIEKGANLNLQDSYKNTALYVALKKDHKDVAELLMQKGARKDIKNKNEFTAQQLGENSIEKLVEEWLDLYHVFYTSTLSNTNISEAKIVWMEQQWSPYHEKLTKWLNALPFTNTFTRSLQDNLKKALEALKNPWEPLKKSFSKPFDRKPSNEYVAQLKKLPSKYNLGKIGRVGDNRQIQEFKSLLADKIIPAIIDVYALGEMKDEKAKK